MADYYLQFSETLDRLKPKEERWLAEQLAADPTSDCPVFLLDYKEREADNMDFGFQWAFQGEGTKRCLWFHADEYGDPWRLAHLVQKFLKRFRPKTCWSLSYANTCSKPRADGFGGGALFVTAGTIHAHSSDEFLHRQHQAFKAARGKLAKSRLP